MAEDFLKALAAAVGGRPVALVTGASAGLGRLYAERLAAAGCDVILTARREERLVELAGELEKKHGAKSLTLAVDLGEPGAARKLHADVAEAGWRVDVLINNAGFGHYGA